MRRRDFFKKTALGAIGASVLSPFSSFAGRFVDETLGNAGKAKNIIFMVSDGMSIGTLNMADMMRQRKEGRESNWLSLYSHDKVRRALMDTASANSLITDSAAASSSWGGGIRVPNGSLNVNADGSFNKPILQKFKAAGKSVGCVTSVTITHATPAGFCVNSVKRSAEPAIALQYMDLGFDIMMGGGEEFFSANKRPDKQDLFTKYQQAGFTVLKNRDDMNKLATNENKPILGVFHDGGLPYALDRENDAALATKTPSLAEMTKAAIKQLKNNNNGFVLQVEGGKVDWAAHANDPGGLIYDQLAFDDAVGEAMAFAEADKETLVIITTDHGNANPGLFSGAEANKNFDRIQTFKHTNDWILNGVDKSYSVARLIERIEFAQGYAIATDEAKVLLKHYEQLDSEGIYNPRRLPFQQLAQYQRKHLSIGWASMDHSADYVELAMYGPGSEDLKPFIKNTALHNFMLQTAGIQV
ncbi:alkaline phosphatase [Sphingobacterium haloxyli]|uniref:Alkaline phosphatase n=1 Tax=Sphingobacterium haloxyli TaxID=2100533 RepID=A0A2S9J3Y6_9SPHI|nr:alkaline phosphatase [Sphingobacterium haloxyli]PRD47497.1 alkaline phosphatase [Sphingobacterium haloxyli]